MTILDALRGEHGVLYAMFAQIEQSAPHSTDAAALRATARLLESAIGSHARLEDELLFIPLERYLGKEIGPLAVMRSEHEAIEGMLSRATDAVAAADVSQMLLEVVRLARQHFAKEERVLFALTGQIMSDDELAKRGRRWAQRRGVTVAEQPAGFC